MYTLDVLDVQHYTDRLFRFQTTRPQGFRFRSGEFVMIGLAQEEGKPLLRAYSVASPNWHDALEFYSIKVADGPLTSRLQKIEPGDALVMRKKAVGTLVHDALLPGQKLYLLSTGTGIAPFASIIRDPETYEKFEQVILVHTCRLKAELSYGFELMAAIKKDDILSTLVGNKLIHYPTTTRESSSKMGRLTDLMRSGRLFEDIGVQGFDSRRDKVMICGSMAMLQDCKALCLDFTLKEGSNAQPADFVIEKAFVD